MCTFYENYKNKLEKTESTTEIVVKIQKMITVEPLLYSRDPLLRPPSDWSGRKTGVVVHEGLGYFIACAGRVSTC